METIAEAKQYLRENWEVGVDCPCCNRLVKRYNYSLNSGSARSLIIMYQLDKQYPGKWLHLQQEFAKQGMNANGMNYILLHWWGLLESQIKNDDKEKRASGYWRITNKGKMFVENRILLPSYVLIYNNKLMGVSEKNISIVDSLRKKFSYQELMGIYYKEEVPVYQGQGGLL